MFTEVLERIAAALNIESHELFTVPSSVENSMEKLHKEMIKEIREIIIEVMEKTHTKKQK